jgi:hypothetical protein
MTLELGNNFTFCYVWGIIFHFLSAKYFSAMSATAQKNVYAAESALKNTKRQFPFLNHQNFEFLSNS